MNELISGAYLGIALGSSSEVSSCIMNLCVDIEELGPVTPVVAQDAKDTVKVTIWRAFVYT